MTTYRIQGIEQLRANFAAFPKAIATKALGQALAKAAALIRNEAKLRAPVATGRLAANIIVAKDQKPQYAGMDARYVVFVKYKGKDAPIYWRYVEFGTSKMSAKPYMRPAFEVMKEAALKTILQSLSDAIPRITASLGK